MAVNLVNSDDIKVTQTGDNIQLNTKVNIQTLESNIETNTNNIENLQNGNVYSTDEIKTNKVWIDGKPIYRKVIENTLPSISPSGVQNVNIPHNISNFESLVNISGYLLAGSQREQIINFPVYTSAGNLLTIYEVTTNNIVLRSRNEGWNAVYGLKFIIEYTKTTD